MVRGSLILILVSVLVISGCIQFSFTEDDILECMTNYQESCLEFDLNGDGFVNILDAVLFTSGSYSGFGGNLKDIFGSESTRDGEVVSMIIQSISSTSGAGNLEIYVGSTEDIGGFQFSLTGLYISGASGGLATSSGFMFSVGCEGECIIAFSLTGASIPTSSMPGVLVEVSYSDHYGGEVCFKPGEGDNGPYNIVSDSSASELSTTWVDACGEGGVSGCNDQTACNYDADVTIPDGSCEYAEDNFDCDGNCVEEVDCTGECGGSAYEDDCGTCDVYPSNDCIWGCTVDTACNYDADATDDDGSCNYAEENYDCEGNCVEEVDCNGECGGSATICEDGDACNTDGCFVCIYPDNYPNNLYDCWGNCINYDCAGICGGSNICGCMNSSACNYDADATIDDGSCGGGFPNELTTEPGDEGCWCTNDVWNVEYLCRFEEPTGFDIGLEQDLYFGSVITVGNTHSTAAAYCRSRVSLDMFEINVDNIVFSTDEIENGYNYYVYELAPLCDWSNLCDEDYCNAEYTSDAGYCDGLGWWVKWEEWAEDGHPEAIPANYLQGFTCEFKNCYEIGDINGDLIYNVLDLVSLANCVLTSDEVYCNCAGDMNNDGTHNVLDIVALANCILSGTCG